MSTEHLKDYELVGKTEVFRENLPQIHFFSLQISYDLTWDRTWVAAVESRRLTA
jgi:hypothetical protein